MLDAALAGCDQFERLGPHRFGHRPAADALRADLQRAVGAADGDSDFLEIRLELTTSDAGHLGADAAEVLGFAAGRDPVAEDRLLPTNLALGAHGSISTRSRE